jgi:hypothetical protein
MNMNQWAAEQQWLDLFMSREEYDWENDADILMDKKQEDKRLDEEEENDA